MAIPKDFEVGVYLRLKRINENGHSCNKKDSPCGLLFYREDGNIMYVRNVGSLPTRAQVQHPRLQ